MESTAFNWRLGVGGELPSATLDKFELPSFLADSFYTASRYTACLSHSFLVRGTPCYKEASIYSPQHPVDGLRLNPATINVAAASGQLLFHQSEARQVLQRVC